MHEKPARSAGKQTGRGTGLLRRQFLPALETPAGKNVAAVGGAHALTEAMDLFPLPDLGLERHFHNTVPLSVNIQGRSRGASKTPVGGKSHSVTFSYYNCLWQALSRAKNGSFGSKSEKTKDYIIKIGPLEAKNGKSGGERVKAAAPR